MSLIKLDIPNTSLVFIFGVDSNSAVFVHIKDTTKDSLSGEDLVLSAGNDCVVHHDMLTYEQRILADALKYRYSVTAGDEYGNPVLYINEVTALAKAFGMPIDAAFQQLVFDTLV